MTTAPALNVPRRHRAPLAAFVLVVSTWLSACELTNQATTAEPLIEAIEGTRPQLTTRADSSAPPPGSTQPLSSPTPAPTQVAFASPSSAVTAPSSSSGGTIGPTAPSNTTATPTSTARPGETRTPLPTANLTLPPTPTSTARPGETRTPLPTANLTLPPTLTPPGGNPNPAQPSATPSDTPTATTNPSDCHPATQKTLPNAGWAISRVCIYDAGDSTWEVYGELTNNTGGDQADVDVEVNLYGSAGSTPATDYSLLDVLTLPNGAIAPFIIPTDIITGGAPLEYAFSVSATLTTDSPRQDLQASGLTSRSGSDVVFTGQVTNPGSDLTDRAELLVTFYGKDGNVIATGYGTVLALDLAGGQTTPFVLYAVGQPDLIDLSHKPAILVLGY